MTESLTATNMSESTRSDFFYNLPENKTTEWSKNTVGIDQEIMEGKATASVVQIKEQAIHEAAKVSTFTEDILQWWIGRVEEVRDDFFVASLRDLQGVRSTAEIDIGAVLEEQQKYIFIGAEFAFFVSRENRKEGRQTVNKVEFSVPYVWTEESEEKAKQLQKDLFPEKAF